MVFPFRTFTKSAKETQAMGERLGTYVLTTPSAVPRVICLWGDLGSGKTTFVQGLARAMGISKRLLSPTFIIVRHYDIPNTKHRLHHIDLYRFADQKEVGMIGLPEILEQPESITCIEWPERLGTLLPKTRIDVRCAVEVDGGHTIDIVKI